MYFAGDLPENLLLQPEKHTTTGAIMSSEEKCPVAHGNGKPRQLARSSRDWWPDQLNIAILHQNSSLSNPMKAEFDYAQEFKNLDLDAVVKDLHAVMTDSQEWWPADFGHYGPLYPYGVALCGNIPHS